ncbi:MAG: hypothetical protein V1824_03510, partial [archaeon]
IIIIFLVLLFYPKKYNYTYSFYQGDLCQRVDVEKPVCNCLGFSKLDPKSFRQHQNSLCYGILYDCKEDCGYALLMGAHKEYFVCGKVHYKEGDAPLCMHNQSINEWIKTKN